MSEWPKEHDWKSCVRPKGVPGVRIPLSPPSLFYRDLLQFKPMHYVYILQSELDEDIGKTVDLKRRYSEHSRGQVESTKHRRPLKLLCYEAYHTKKRGSRTAGNISKKQGREKKISESESQRVLSHHAERYRSGRNGIDSKSIWGPQAPTGVRIPLSPPYYKIHKTD